MRNHNSFLFTTLLFLLLAGCANGNGGLRKYVVNQMFVSAQSDQIQISVDELDSWNPVGNTFVLMNTTVTSDLNCLFIAEVSGFGSLLFEPDAILPLQVRILVDDEVAFPARASFTHDYRPVENEAPIGHMSSHSFLAVMRDVPPGIHTILVQWKGAAVINPVVGDRLPRMGSRTLTVWQTIEQNLPVLNKPKLSPLNSSQNTTRN